MTSKNKRFEPLLLTTFIETYQKLPCLWNRNDPGYRSKSRRRAAFSKLLLVVQEKHPDATMDTVITKIGSLRACHRVERLRIERLKLANKVDIKPKLWYYDKMSFLNVDEARRYVLPEGATKKYRKRKPVKKTILEAMPTETRPHIILPKGFKKTYNNKRNLARETIELEIMPTETVMIKQESEENDNVFICEEEQTLIQAAATALQPYPDSLSDGSIEITDAQSSKQTSYTGVKDEPNTARYRAQVDEYILSDNTLNKPSSSYAGLEDDSNITKQHCTQVEIDNSLSDSPSYSRLGDESNEGLNVVSLRGVLVEDEYDAIGINVAAKLRKMPPGRREIAENLINAVLSEAQMKKLNTTTVIATL